MDRNRRGRASRIVQVLAVVLVLVIGLVVIGPGTGAWRLWADVVHLRTGRSIQGEILEENEFGVVIQTKFGVQRIDRERIANVERVLTPRQIHQQKVNAAQTADDLFQAGQYAQENNMRREAYEDFQAAVRVDPDHEAARNALGFHKHEGQWLPDEEYYAALGWEYVGGQWYPPDEADGVRERIRDEARAKVDAAQAQLKEELKYRPWSANNIHLIETTHYVVKCNSTDEVARGYSDFMEKLYKKYYEVFSEFPITHQGRSNIYIVSNYDQFLSMFGPIGVQPGVGGFYRPEPALGLPGRVVCAFHGSFGDTSTTYHVLAHEGTHQFEHLILENMNDYFNVCIWLLEGLAVYFGDGHYLEGGEVKIGLPRDRLANLQQAIRNGSYVHLRDLIRMPQRAFGGAEYAYAWGLLHFMFHGKHPKVDMLDVYKKYFRQFVAPEPGQQIRSAEQSARLFESLLGVPLNDFEEDWKRYIMGLQMDPIGQVVKDRYVSRQMKFEVALPGRGWVFEEHRLLDGEKIVLENTETTGRIAVRAEGNWLLDTADSLIGRLPWMLQNGFSSIDNPQQVFDGIQAAFHEGHDGKLIEFQGQPRRDGPSSTGFERNRPQQCKWYVFATVDKIYILKFETDAGRFDANQEDFAAALKSFKILD